MSSYKIANVKISLKTSPISLDIVSNNLLEKGYYCKRYQNFLVIKTKFTFILFKTNSKGENHVNITKIPQLSYIKEAIKVIKKLTLCTVKSKTIDNIIATTSANHNLNLKKIVSDKKFSKIKYNNEKFPGLFLKFEKATAILFHSGKIVIVGSKSEKNIKWLIKKIFANI
jgi:TATA-box binding protein (TBP) (component of TFIID and TFIIIB)